MDNDKSYGLAILRVLVGVLFIIPGIMKLIDSSGITGMLTGLGFPMPQVLAWVLLLSEIIFGISLVLGFKTKYTVWPLVIIMAVIVVKIAVPGALEDPSGWVNVMFHLVSIGALITVFLEGPGAYAIGK